MTGGAGSGGETNQPVASNTSQIRICFSPESDSVDQVGYILLFFVSKCKKTRRDRTCFYFYLFMFLLSNSCWFPLAFRHVGILMAAMAIQVASQSGERTPVDYPVSWKSAPLTGPFKWEMWMKPWEQRNCMVSGGGVTVVNTKCERKNATVAWSLGTCSLRRNVNSKAVDGKPTPAVCLEGDGSLKFKMFSNENKGPPRNKFEKSQPL